MIKFILVQVRPPPPVLGESSCRHAQPPRPSLLTEPPRQDSAVKVVRSVRRRREGATEVKRGNSFPRCCGTAELNVAGAVRCVGVLDDFVGQITRRGASTRRSEGSEVSVEFRRGEFCRRTTLGLRGLRQMWSGGDWSLGWLVGKNARVPRRTTA
jgi:hypothetical protein